MEINSRIGSRKAQSAMEYLMTYGWAILIIGVVLAALAEMGLFNPSTYAQSICDLPANLFCKSFFLSTSGVLAVTIENTMQDPINITAVGCGNQPLANMQSITPVYLPQGHSYTFNVQCEGATNSHIGQLYAGYITLNYTDDVTLFSQTVSGKVIVKTVETSTTSTSSTSTTILSTSTSTTTSSTSTTTSTTTSSTSTTTLTSTSTTTSSTSTTTSTTTSSTSTTTILYYYVPITLSNSQSSATPSPFQQMITVNSLAYKQYEAGGLTNVAFYNASGTQLDSWLESGNSNTSTNTVYWVKLPNGIPASSSITIYMRFYQPLSNTQFNSNNDGEAPQLSSTYAEYDDGASVFNVYQNFAGSSCPSGWSCQSGAKIDNGVTLNGADINSTSAYYPQILDAYVVSTSGNAKGEEIEYFTNSNNNAFNTNQPYWGHGNIGSDVDGSITVNANPPAFTVPYIQSLGWSGSTLYWWANYTNEYTEGTSLSSSSPYYLQIAAWPSGAPAVIQWVRTRAFPPGGVMPSVSFGGGS